MTNDFDRELIELITDVDGEVWPLSELVDLRGATVVSRAIAEVRRLNEERRELWVGERRALSRRMRKSS